MKLDLPDRIARRLGDGPEIRTYAISDLDIRATDDGTLTLEGYASVFGHGYEMYGGPAKYGWTEYCDPGCCDKTLSERADVQLLVNHGGMPLARTKSGTLELSADNTGLKVRAQLDPCDPDVQRLRPKMERGDMDEMSMAFRVLRQEWNEDYTERHITEISLHKGDVSVVNYGANDATSASIRSLADLLELDDDDLLVEARALDTDDPFAALAELRNRIDSLLRAGTPPAPEPLGMSLDLARALCA